MKKQLARDITGKFKKRNKIQIKFGLGCGKSELF